jgi:hypothetical protein
MIKSDQTNKGYSQRQLRVGELVNSQSLCDTTRWNRHEGNRWCID